MKISKFLLMILCILFLLYFPGNPVFGFSTHPSTANISRSFDKVQAFRNESILVTINFENTGNIDLRGFYCVDHIPEGLTVNTVSVKINGNDIHDYVEEFGSVGDVYNGTIPYRWILEAPSLFDENNPIGSNSTLEIVYSVSSVQLGTFNFDEFHWVGYYQSAVEEEQAAFGHSEDIDKQIVTFLNTSPLANNDTTTTSEDTPITINVLANDEDQDGTIDPDTILILDGPTNGGININGDWTVTYTPDTNFNGTDDFTYAVQDNDGTSSNEATVTVTVTAVNDTPVANSQTILIDEDTFTSITLTGNDTEEDPLTFAVVSQPTDGTLSGTAPNLTYSPNANYNGPDSFTFMVNDGIEDSNSATIFITVNSVNDSPTAENDTAITSQNKTLIVNVIANDTDSDGTIDPTTLIIVITPNNGSININDDGTVTYTPAVNFTGTDIFTYEVADNEGAISNEATVSVTVKEPVDRLDLDKKIKGFKEGNASEEEVKEMIRQYMKQIP